MKLIIPPRVLESCLQGARESHPNEFLGLLAGRVAGDAVYAERLYLAPLSDSDEYSASFNPFNVPLTIRAVASFHSHPSGPALPSRADLELFSRQGSAHLIAKYPYGSGDVNAFDSSGRKIVFKALP